MSDREKRLELLLQRLMQKAEKMTKWIDEPPQGFWDLIDEIEEELRR